MVKLPVTPSDAVSLRKALHEKIDAWNPRMLSVVNRILLQLEAEELAEELDKAFDEDRKQGKLSDERIHGVIKGVRAEHPYK